jgi:hypothetical protein
VLTSTISSITISASIASKDLDDEEK